MKISSFVLLKPTPMPTSFFLPAPSSPRRCAPNSTIDLRPPPAARRSQLPRLDPLQLLRRRQQLGVRADEWAALALGQREIEAVVDRGVQIDCKLGRTNPEVFRRNQ